MGIVRSERYIIAAAAVVANRHSVMIDANDFENVQRTDLTDF